MEVSECDHGYVIAWYSVVPSSFVLSDVLFWVFANILALHFLMPFQPWYSFVRFIAKSTFDSVWFDVLRWWLVIR